MEAPNIDAYELHTTIDDMKSSIASVREVIKSLLEKAKQPDLDMKDGISLLSVKHHILLSYLQSLLLVSSRRALGHTLSARTPPAKPFSVDDREARGNEAGDLVDSLMEGRVTLEKIKTLESRMRYQIDKLVRIAEEPEKQSTVIDDPLAFGPNPQNLVNNDISDERDTSSAAYSRQQELSLDPSSADGIYHPPRIVPVPYIEGNPKSKSSRKSRAPIPSALASLSLDPSLPHAESTTGLGSAPSHGNSSGRAAYLKRLTEFEEENFGRVVMKKSDAKRRARDEEDLALGGELGGGGVGKGRRRAGGLADEFGDILRSVGRTRSVGSSMGDGYEELRQKGRKKAVLERSRTRTEGVRSREDAFGGAEESEGGGGGGGRMKKRTRFEQETKIAKKKMGKNRR